MDKDKAEAYQVVGDIICKVGLVFVICIGWLAMVGFLIYNPNMPLGVGVANIPILMMALIQHYFTKRR